MIAKILQPKNLYKACKRVVSNGGSSGVDNMKVTELKEYLSTHQSDLIGDILNRSYRPDAIRGVGIPKKNDERTIAKGGCLVDIQESEPRSGRAVRLLGIPTVVDRYLQQSVSQILMTRFELQLSKYSYGFRPKKNMQQALIQSLSYINSGYQDIVDIDLSKFFDEVAHYKILQLIYETVKCEITLGLIRKWLRAPILIEGKLCKRRKGLPQGSPLSPLLSNIMLDQLDKYLEGRGYKYVRYADDFSIYTKSQVEARTIGSEVFLYLKKKLALPINKEKDLLPHTYYQS